MSRKSPQRQESEEQKRRDDKVERKASSSKDEDRKEETGQDEKTDESKDSASPDIKVKTLEEILREKALKKLEERRAQNKEMKTEEKEFKEEEENLDKTDKVAEKAEEEVSSVGESENSEKSPLKKVAYTRNKDNSIEGTSKKAITVRKVSSTNASSKDDNSIDGSSDRTVRRKVSSNERRNWPLQKVISTVSKDSISAKSSAENAGIVEPVLPLDKDEEKEEASREPPSPFQGVRVKSFEEIMELKRKRRAEKEGSEEAPETVERESTTNAPEPASNSTVLALSPPKRLKRIVKKQASGGNEKEPTAVSSSSKDSTVSSIQPTRKRTVFVMEKPGPSKQVADNGKWRFFVFVCVFCFVKHVFFHDQITTHVAPLYEYNCVLMNLWV